jgi:hypothetical protein
MSEPAAPPVSGGERRRLWALAACAALLGVSAVSFNLLYLHLPPGRAPTYDFAPNVGVVYPRLFSRPQLALTPAQFVALSLALQAAMWGAFLAGLALLARLRGGAGEKTAFKVVIAGGAAAALALIATPPVLSPDLYHYALFGRMIITRGLNPYVTPGNALHGDPLWPLAIWQDYTSHYGPVFTWLSVAAAWIGGGRPIATAIAFKTLATGFGGLAAWSAVGLAKQQNRSGLVPLVLLAWNPLVLIETAGSGHNEMVMIGLALCGLWVFRSGRTILGFLLLVASVHVKWITAALAGLIAVAHLRELPGARARVVAAIKLVSAGAAATVVLYLPFWEGGSTFGATLRLMVEGRTDPGAPAIPPSHHLVFAVVTLIALAVVVRHGHRFLLEMAAIVSLTFVTFLFPWVYPWYLIPAGALLAAGAPSRLNVALLVIATATSIQFVARWAQLISG